MSLRDRLKKPGAGPGGPLPGLPPNMPAQDTPTSSNYPNLNGNQASSAPAQPVVQVQPVANRETNHNVQPKKGDRFEEVKTKVHTMLVENLNISPTDEIGKDEVTIAAHQFLEKLLNSEKIPMGTSERNILVQELVEEVVGLGPLEPLLRDPIISEIMVNGPKNVYIERNGKIQKTNVVFKDNAHLMHIIERIVSAVGRRVDEKTPMVDARLKDGSRFNAIIPPLALDGASISIRKFKADAGTLEKLLGWGSMTPAMSKTLEAAVRCHLNIIISGGTGSGKTTMLNSLSALIAPDERIITIEDSAELQLKQEHVVRLETRPPNIEGEGQITARQLLINSLRMRPDRIVVGECRGPETLEMLQAMNTGHDGSLTTLHSNTPRDAISRIVTMCMMNDNPLPEKTIRQQIASAVNLIVQVSRLMDGQRKTTSIAEITGMEGDIVTMQEIFKFEQYGLDDNGRVIGKHVATGVRPRFAEICKAKGIDLPSDIFDKDESGPSTPPPPIPKL
ncbi:MAG: putative conjugal transfer protein [Vampirovibrio sp.]|nr:putative conjugal transfer protein [Vampirovibrio sp.]